MCDATYHKSYGLGLTAATILRKSIAYTLDGIIVFFY